MKRLVLFGAALAMMASAAPASRADSNEWVDRVFEPIFSDIERRVIEDYFGDESRFFPVAPPLNDAVGGDGKREFVDALGRACKEVSKPGQYKLECKSDDKSKRTYVDASGGRCKEEVDGRGFKLSCDYPSGAGVGGTSKRSFVDARGRQCTEEVEPGEYELDCEDKRKTERRFVDAYGGLCKEKIDGRKFKLDCKYDHADHEHPTAYRTGFPIDLEQSLPVRPDFERTVVGNDVVLVDILSGTVVDILRDVIRTRAHKN